MTTIDPERLYPFKEAARLIPSPYGQPICVRTLFRWLGQGLFQAECRQVMRRRWWFVRGSEILRLNETEKVSHAPAGTPVRSPAQAQRDHAEAERRLEERARRYGVGAKSKD